MARLFPRFKTFRANTTILSNDFNQFQDALSAALDRLGELPPEGETGVSSTFTVNDPTANSHAVNLGYLSSNIDSLVSGSLADEIAAAQSAQAAAELARDVAQSHRDATAALRFSDALHLAFFFGQS